MVRQCVALGHSTTNVNKGQLCECWSRTAQYCLSWVMAVAQGAEARLAAGDMQKIFALCCVTSFDEVRWSTGDYLSPYLAARLLLSPLGCPFSLETNMLSPRKRPPWSGECVLIADLQLECVLQVILVEADSLPLRDPEELFETAVFKQHGSLFWPGHWNGLKGDRPGYLDPAAYNLFGLQRPWESDSEVFATAETGQLLINRQAASQLGFP